MNHPILLLLSLTLIIGLCAPAYAQTISDHVVINEVDTNPSGDDSQSLAEWVELYNPSNFDVDLSGWEIASTTVLKKTFTIPDGTTISPGDFLLYNYQTIWFTDSNESVELRNSDGVIIDKTPVIADLDNNFFSWQRVYDGNFDWEFALSSAGGSNGQFVTPSEYVSAVTTVSSDKTSYVFDDTAIIQGTVSKRVFIEKPTFQIAPIKINISGPDFSHSVSLYPDSYLNYKTTLDLVQVLGVNEGTYDVAVTYDEVTTTTSFTLNSEIISASEQIDDSFSIQTNKSEYALDDLIQLTGFTSQIIPLQSMKFTVVDPNGKQIDSGNLFPVDGKFNTDILISPINFVYGTYNVISEYSEQTASVSFNLIESVSDVSTDTAVLSPLTFQVSVSEFAWNDCRNCLNVIKSDVTEVLLNQYLTFTGVIPNFIGLDGLAVPSAYYNLVEFSFKTSDGKLVTFIGHVDNHGGNLVGEDIAFTTTAIPDKLGAFSTDIQIPAVVFSEGDYVVTAKYGPFYKSNSFSIISETSSPIESEKSTSISNVKTIIEKTNRISADLISIYTQEKILNEQSVKPRVLSGSMMTVSKDAQSNVNLQVTSESGVCIIGPGDDCLVNESTRKPGQIFEVVNVDGLNLNVRYSGPDVRLEKFSILPESSDDFLPDTNWNVQIIKDDEISRFYYKITYKTSE